MYKFTFCITTHRLVKGKSSDDEDSEKIICKRRVEHLTLMCGADLT